MQIEHSVSLTFFDSYAGERRTVYRRVPLEIGRTVENENDQLRVDWGGGRVSRLHLVLHSQIGGAPELEDVSSNGTTILDDGRGGGGYSLRRGDRFTLDTRVRIAIGEAELEVESGSSAPLFLRWPYRSVYHTCGLSLDRPFVLGRSWNEAGLVLSEEDSSVSRRHALVTPKAEGRFRLHNVSSHNFLLFNNYQRVGPDEQVEAEVGDAFFMGKQRVQLLERNRPMIECRNPKCQLLNMQDHESECRWCGWHLADGITVSINL